MGEPVIFVQSGNIVSSDTTRSTNSDKTYTELKRMEYEETSLENYKQSETTKETSNWKETCRICANARDRTIPIFESEGSEHKLSNKIHMYLPIEVSETDSLPLKLCYHCAATLLAWHEIATGCLDAQKRLLQMQSEIQQKEPSQSKDPKNSCSDGIVKEIITAREESVNDYQSIATQKLQKSSLLPSSHEIQEKEANQLKNIEQLNSNELVQGNIAANELVDDPEPIATDKLEISNVAQKKKESSLIHEQEESCVTQQLEQTRDNVEQSTVNQQPAERSDRMKKPFKLLIGAQSIFRMGRKIKIEVTDDKSVKKDDEDTMLKNTLCPSVEERLSMMDSPGPAIEGLNSAEETFTNAEESRRNSARSEKVKNETFAEYERVYAEKSEDSQDRESMTTDESNSNDNCTSIKVKCTVCSREFSAIKDLQIHAKDHKDLPELRKIYQCVECDKSFRLKDSFVRHLRIHRDERPFTCHVCGKQFRDSGGLSRHLKDVHAKLKNFSCDICGNSFSSKATRDDHRRTHTGERPYVCNTCKKTFKSKACLYSHNKLHTNEFPHSCTYCNKKFRRRQEMLVHATTHTGEKNYSCDVCFMRFRVKTEVVRHKLTHSEEKPFVCAKCGLRFRQNRYLNNHIKSRHVQSWKD